MNVSPPKQRIILQTVMTKTFGKELRTLDPKLQSILVDDLVTSFLNRLTVLKRIQETQKGFM